MDVFPLIFEPIFKPRIWGGRSLERLLGKRLPEGELIGESWEVADLEDDQSIVAQGPAKGKTLGELVRTWGKELLGGASLFEGRFPLLIKYLDARETLSVQVHPDEATARRLGGRVRVKNEAWYIIDAAPDGAIYRGLRKGVDADALKRAVAEGRVEEVLNRIAARKGHCYYLPSGTVHALGAGVVVAEVQTPSDVTYRLYDWNRVDPSTGRGRELHLEEALGCISHDPTPLAVEQPEHVAAVWTSVTSLLRCPSFVIERIRMPEGVEHELPYLEMVIWTVLEGCGRITFAGSASPVAFEAGDTVLIPAGLSSGRVVALQNCCWLEITIPIPSRLKDLTPADRQALKAPEGGGFVQLDVGGKPETSE